MKAAHSYIYSQIYTTTRVPDPIKFVIKLFYPSLLSLTFIKDSHVILSQMVNNQQPELVIFSPQISLLIPNAIGSLERTENHGSSTKSQNTGEGAVLTIAPMLLRVQRV